MKKALSLQEKLALLDEALSEYTPEKLKEKLEEFPAVGPTLSEFSLSLNQQLKQLGENNG